MSTGKASQDNDRFFYELYLAGFYEVNFRRGLVRNAKTKKVYRRGPCGYVEVPKKVRTETGFGKRCILSHRLIWMAYHKRVIRKGYDINHKDGDKSNCRPDNLEEATPSQNATHAVETGLRKSRVGQRARNRVLTNAQVHWARRMFNKGAKAKELRQKLGVSKQTFYSMINGSLYTDV